MIMKKVYFVLFMCVAVAIGQQTWGQRAHLKGFVEYFTAVTQETVYEIERRGWSTLKLTDISQNLNLQMYKWVVNGTVLYTNGFLVSVQKIEVSGVTQRAGSSSFEGISTTRSSVNGKLTFRNVKLGYDVISNIIDIGEQRYTGDIMLSEVSWDLSIQKNNYTSEELTVTSRSTLSGGIIRMAYRPTNNVTTVLSRLFRPSQTHDGVDRWKDVISAIVLDVATNKIPYPEICFLDC